MVYNVDQVDRKVYTVGPVSLVTVGPPSLSPFARMCKRGFLDPLAQIQSPDPWGPIAG